MPAWASRRASSLSDDQAAAIGASRARRRARGPTPSASGGSGPTRRSESRSGPAGSCASSRTSAFRSSCSCSRYAADQTGWKDVRADFERQDDLFAAIASGFSWHATWALERGLLRGYVRCEERRRPPRARFGSATQIARSGGLPLPVEVAYDDFTEDILENRMLRTATQLLLRLPRVTGDARRRLLRLRAILDGVEPLAAWRGGEGAADHAPQPALRAGAAPRRADPRAALDRATAWGRSARRPSSST